MGQGAGRGWGGKGRARQCGEDREARGPAKVKLRRLRERAMCGCKLPALGHTRAGSGRRDGEAVKGLARAPAAMARKALNGTVRSLDFIPRAAGATERLQTEK